MQLAQHLLKVLSKRRPGLKGKPNEWRYIVSNTRARDAISRVLIYKGRAIISYIKLVVVRTDGDKGTYLVYFDSKLPSNDSDREFITRPGPDLPLYRSVTEETKYLITYVYVS